MILTPRTRRPAHGGADPRGAAAVTPVASAGERGAVRARYAVVVRGGRAVDETRRVDPAPAPAPAP